MKRVNIPLGEKTHLRAKVISSIKGISLNEYLSSILEDAVKKERGEQR